ncbi:MAG: periplasmic protein TonB [Pyrinomonadaceae bacterium]|nr:periplasmic protein TonB [Pyrinomonadaceae bacterium]
MRKIIFTFASLLLVAQLHTTARAQETKQPAFTLHSRVTQYLQEGNTRTLKEVRYVSSGGSFRAVYINEDGSPYTERVFEPGRGFFNVHHNYRMIVKNRSNPPETATTPPPTVEQLRASPNFVRTEEVLGRTTYLHRIKDDETGAPLFDYYFTPELGRVPLKTVDYLQGKVFSVTEPVSITFGEPDATQLKAPDYEVAERMPISGGVLNGKAISKPTPAYPPIAFTNARPSGVVTVQVLVNEDGTVRWAKAVGGHPLLQQAAVEAARKARFAPTRLEGQPIKVAGVVTYNFVLR